MKKIAAILLFLPQILRAENTLSDRINSLFEPIVNGTKIWSLLLAKDNFWKKNKLEKKEQHISEKVRNFIYLNMF